MLAEKLKILVENSKKNIPTEARSIMTDATAKVQSSINGRKIPAVGEKLPSFHLANSAGRVFNSEDLLPSSRLILTFFRGSW